MKITNLFGSALLAKHLVLASAMMASANADDPDPADRDIVTMAFPNDADPQGPYKKASWEKLKQAFQDAGAHVEVVSDEYLYTRDMFIYIGDQAFFPAGKNLEHDMDDDTAAYADYLAEQGFRVEKIDIPRRQHTQGGNVIYDFQANLVLIGTNNGKLRQSTIEKLSKASGKEVVPIETTEFHLDVSMGLLPTGYVLTKYDQEVVISNPGMIFGQWERSGLTRQGINKLSEIYGSDKLIIMGQNYSLRIHGGKYGSSEIEWREMHQDRFLRKKEEQGAQLININSEHNRGISRNNINLSPNFEVVGNTVIAQELPVEVVQHLQENDYEVNIVQTATFDPWGGPHCAGVNITDMLQHP